MKILLIAVAALFIAGAIAHVLLSGAFSAKVESLRRQVLASQLAGPTDQSLIPPIVLDFALRNGGSVGGTLAVDMTQSAEMRLQPDQPFFHIAGTQRTGSRVPGFVWHASGTMASIIPLQVIDSYVDGTGALEARSAGSITVASASGPDVDKGEAMRFLAELPWNPDAIISATGLTWRQIDDATVEVSMGTNGGVARVRLLFDPAGDIIGIEADDRPRAVGNLSLPTPWIGRFSNYEQVGAYRWPRHGEIAWALPEGEFIYWRGDILSVTPAGP